jgi:hypothetical protein
MTTQSALQSTEVSHKAIRLCQGRQSDSREPQLPKSNPATADLDGRLRSAVSSSHLWVNGNSEHSNSSLSAVAFRPGSLRSELGAPRSSRKCLECPLIDIFQSRDYAFQPLPVYTAVSLSFGEPRDARKFRLQRPRSAVEVRSKRLKLCKPLRNCAICLLSDIFCSRSPRIRAFGAGPK